MSGVVETGPPQGQRIPTKILFLWDSDYPWDVRIEKICGTLAQRGCEVHLVCRNRSRNPCESIHDNIHIHRISCLPKTWGRLNDAFTFPAFFSPVWLSCLKRVTTERDFDIIIVRDLPMALAALAVGKNLGIPVILDMAECYPEMIRLIWRFEPFKFRNLLIRNPFLADLVECLTIRQVDHIFAMVEESRTRLMRKGVPKEKITIVSNTPVLQRFQEAKPTFPGALEKHKGELILLYVGFLNYSRGLDTVLAALARSGQERDRTFLALLGTGTAEKRLMQMTKEFNLESHVGFEGWVDNGLVPSYVASADVCLVPHHVCGHWNNTVPNKLFDYMASAKPVLVSDVDPMRRIVQEAECGLVYKDNDPDDLLLQLRQLNNPELRKRLGDNGAHAVRDRYNWGQDSLRLLASIDLLMRTSQFSHQADCHGER